MRAPANAPLRFGCACALAWLLAGAAWAQPPAPDPDGGTEALIDVLAPPPPRAIHRLPLPENAGPAEPPESPTPWILCGVLGAALFVTAGWAVTERYRRVRAADELSRMRSYVAILQKREAKVPPPPSQGARAG